MSDLKLVFHVNENDRWPFTIRSVRNFIADESAADCVVVANGGAIRSFSQLEADPIRQEKIRALAEQGVKFVVCQVAMEERQVKPELIPDTVTVVPAGVVEIARLQAEGYGYIKA